MSEQSDTPRTDAAVHIASDYDDAVSVDFARDLERALATATHERDEARAEVNRMRAELLRYMGGESDHLYNGDCPDEREHKSRDPNCPACRRMIELAATEAP